MKPEILHHIQVRDVTAALGSLDEVALVQHHVSRTEIRRYVALTDQQWWQLVSFVREKESQRNANQGG